MTDVAAFVPDLLDRSKVAALGGVTFVARASDLAGTDAPLVIVDLTRPGVVDVLPDIRGRVVAFANHTSRELMAAARAAGADEVLARSEFFGHRLAELGAERQV
jgi:hypothetical protein